MPDHAATFPLDAHSRFPTKIPMPDWLRPMFKAFIPYLVDLAGIQEDPWNIDDEVIFTQWIGYTKRVLKQAPGDEALRPVIISNVSWVPVASSSFLILMLSCVVAVPIKSVARFHRQEGTPPLNRCIGCAPDA